MTTTETDPIDDHSAAAASRRWRDRRRGGPPRTVEPCGTRAAAKRHRRNDEPIDDACRDAERAYQREASARARARAGSS